MCETALSKTVRTFLSRHQVILIVKNRFSIQQVHLHRVQRYNHSIALRVLMIEESAIIQLHKIS